MYDRNEYLIPTHIQYLFWRRFRDKPTFFASVWTLKSFYRISRCAPGNGVHVHRTLRRKQAYLANIEFYANHRVCCWFTVFYRRTKKKKRELSSKWLWNGTTGSTKVKVVFDWQLFESIENAMFEIYFGRTWQLHRLIYLTFMFVSDEPFFRSSSEYKLRHEFGPNAFKYRRKTELMQNQLLFIFSSPSKRFMQILNPMLLTNCHRWIDWYERFQFISFRNN